MTNMPKNEAREHARRILENAKNDSTLAIADKRLLDVGILPEDLSEVLAQMKEAKILVTWDDEVVALKADEQEKPKQAPSAGSVKG